MQPKRELWRPTSRDQSSGERENALLKSSWNRKALPMELEHLGGKLNQKSTVQYSCTTTPKDKKGKIILVAHVICKNVCFI